MSRKRRDPHIYRDVNVTPDRLTRFALAEREVQISVLAKLREDAADDTWTTVTSYLGILLAAFFAVCAPLIAVDISPPVRDSPIATAILATGIMALLVVVTCPPFISVLRGQVRKQRALVWLAAFEAELARRHRLHGAAARRWQRLH